MELPVRKDSLPPPRPALPPKDELSKSPRTTMSPLLSSTTTTTTTMASRLMSTPLPPLPPSGSQTNSIPRRPVGNAKGNSSKPLPEPVSPVESLSSLYSEYFSDVRSSSGTATTKDSYSYMEPSPPPPKVLPQNNLGTENVKLDLVSPFALPQPVSASNEEWSNDQGQLKKPERGYSEGLPPPPPMKDASRRLPASPRSSRPAPEASSHDNPINDTSSSLTNQSPTQPQIWRRRSIKTEKNLAVPGLKLTSSNGSTAASSSQGLQESLLSEDLSVPKPAFAANSTVSSPTARGFESFPGRNIKPLTQKALPQQPSQIRNEMSPSANKSQNTISQRSFKTPQYSMPQKSPQDRRPPTPEYEKHETQASMVETVRSPASPVSPVSPPHSAGDRPLSLIREEPAPVSRKVIGLGELRPVKSAVALRAPVPTPAPMAHARSPSASDLLFPRQKGMGQTGPRSHSSESLVPPSMNSGRPISPGTQARRGLPRSPAPSVSPGHAATPSVSSIRSQQSLRSQASMDDISDTTTIKQNGTTTTTTTLHSRDPSSASVRNPDDVIVPAKRGEPAYFPVMTMDIAPGTVLPAAPLRESHFECFAEHYRLVLSRNEYYPLACQTCASEDRDGRWTCCFCSVRVCGGCRDELFANGRDLRKVVAARGG